MPTSRSLLLGSGLLVAALVFASPLRAQVDYGLTFAPGESEEWSVTATFPNPDGRPLDFWFARWTAGAYHLADFGRFVAEVQASDRDGEPVEVTRRSDSQFILGARSPGPVTVRYRVPSLVRSVFTDGVIDVEGNRIAADYAYVNPVSLFGFVPALAGEEVRLAVASPAGWKAATALEQDEQGRFRAPSFLRFEDSPLFFSPSATTNHFEVDGIPHAVTVYGKGAEEARSITEGCRRIVEATSLLMQGLPYSHYHFLLAFTPHAGGSGLEHSFSTLILVPEGLGTGPEDRGLWSIVAHEFFHAWCAERIHVEGLHAPDYTRPFSTGTIWVNEGITEYFTQHILLHAGFLGREELLATLHAGGRFSKKGRSSSWADVSRGAAEWTAGRGLLSFVTSMYGTGPKVVLALDLEMRRASHGERGIVDLLRFLRHAYIDRDRGFGEDEMPGLVNGIAQADLSEFHRRFIEGREYPDLDAALDVIGYRLDGRRVVEVEGASPAQLAAREDFFSIPR